MEWLKIWSFHLAENCEEGKGRRLWMINISKHKKIVKKESTNWKLIECEALNKADI
jgi:hypothetical protein